MDKAKELCQLLHRDISVGNVMLTGNKNCEGLLADWDHAGKIELTPGMVYQHFRTVSLYFSLMNAVSLIISTGNMAIYVYSPPAKPG